MRLKGGSWLSSLKGALFPVEGWEMPKFFSMSLMMFMIIYIYTTVRDTKVGAILIKSSGIVFI
jgi:ATP/ADP translocase